MQKLSNMKFIALISRLLVLLLLAKLISLGVWWYLPSEGVELNVKKSYQAKYQRVTFQNMLETLKPTHAEEKEETAKAASINSLLLKGLYGSRHNGFAIIAKKSRPQETSIVAVGESYAGYTLKEIALHEVIFTKNSKEYKLSLAQEDAKFATAVQRVTSQSDESLEKRVSRADIKAYSDDPSRIWKDIGIQQIMDGKKITGFRVIRVKRGSKMETLGLLKGDIITKANNVPFTSLNDVFKLYKNIHKIETLALTIMRNNQEKEIIYEIR